MSRVLIVIDAQRDFITGVLGSEAACRIMKDCQIERLFQGLRFTQHLPLYFCSPVRRH